MSGLCFFAYSVPSRAKSNACMHSRNEPDPRIFQGTGKNSLKNGKKKVKVQNGFSLSSVDILQPFLHSLIILLGDSHK